MNSLLGSLVFWCTDVGTVRMEQPPFQSRCHFWCVFVTCLLFLNHLGSVTSLLTRLIFPVHKIHVLSSVCIHISLFFYPFYFCWSLEGSLRRQLVPLVIRDCQVIYHLIIYHTMIIFCDVFLEWSRPCLYFSWRLRAHRVWVCRWPPWQVGRCAQDPRTTPTRPGRLNRSRMPLLGQCPRDQRDQSSCSN